MDLDLCRALVVAENRLDSTIANLRNAEAMSPEDPGAERLLSEAGDAYCKAVTNLGLVRKDAVASYFEGLPPADVHAEDASAPDTPPPAPQGGQAPPPPPEAGSGAPAAPGAEPPAAGGGVQEGTPPAAAS